MPRLTSARSALARRYSNHPALAMWHISNEYGPTAYTPQSAIAFRDWLRRRYRDLSALNDAWYTRFWGQRYTDWEQIDPPAVPRTWSNPARRLDFQRFVSDALLECFELATDPSTRAICRARAEDFSQRRTVEGYEALYAELGAR